MTKKMLQVKPRHVITSPTTGEAEAVILDIKDYKKIADILEDLADLMTMESLRKEEKNAIPWEDVERRLQEDGII